MSFSSSDNISANIVSYSPVLIAFLLPLGGEPPLFPLAFYYLAALTFIGNVTIRFSNVTFNLSAHLSTDFHFLI